MQTKLLNENFFCIHLTWNGPFLARTTRIVINSIFGTSTRVCTHTRMITLTTTYTHTHTLVDISVHSLSILFLFISLSCHFSYVSSFYWNEVFSFSIQIGSFYPSLSFISSFYIMYLNVFIFLSLHQATESHQQRFQIFSVSSLTLRSSQDETQTCPNEEEDTLLIKDDDEQFQMNLRES